MGVVVTGERLAGLSLRYPGRPATGGRTGQSESGRVRSTVLPLVDCPLPCRCTTVLRMGDRRSGFGVGAVLEWERSGLPKTATTAPNTATWLSKTATEA